MSTHSGNAQTDTADLDATSPVGLPRSPRQLAIQNLHVLLRQRRQLQALLDLDDRLLVDIGLTRELVECEVGKPYWALWALALASTN
jgi:uncharacterized protein YjiS (DUF1127 family)